MVEEWLARQFELAERERGPANPRATPPAGGPGQVAATTNDREHESTSSPIGDGHRTPGQDAAPS